MELPGTQLGRFLTCHFTEEFPFVHAVLESLVAVYEHDRNFIRELTPQLIIAIHVDFMPTESATAMQLG